MNNTITSREDMFWAKMAGRDVDITTMTPPVAASMTEKLMLETAQRIGQGGGGSLPAAGADGDVVTANDGEWVSKSPKYHVEFEVGVGGITTEQSLADINAALVDGKDIKASISLGVIPSELMLVASTQTRAAFIGAFYDDMHNEASQFIVYGVNIDNTDTWDAIPIHLLPNITASDIGKVLNVISDGEGGAEYTLVADKTPIVIHGTVDAQNNTISIANTGYTASSIASLAAAGRAAYLEFPFAAFGGLPLRLPLGMYSSGNDPMAGFAATVFNSTTGYIIKVGFSGQDLTAPIEVATFTVTAVEQ